MTFSFRPRFARVVFLVLSLATCSIFFTPVVWADISVPDLLQVTFDPTGGELVVLIKESELSADSYEWFVDDESVTTEPVALAGELVLFAKTPPARKVFRVIIRRQNEVITGEVVYGGTAVLAPSNARVVVTNILESPK